MLLDALTSKYRDKELKKADLEISIEIKIEEEKSRFRLVDRASSK